MLPDYILAIKMSCPIPSQNSRLNQRLYLREENVTDHLLLKSMKEQAKSVDKAFFQVVAVPVVLRSALDVVHH